MGVLQTSLEAMCKVVKCYFDKFFSSSHPPISLNQLDMINKRVSDSMAVDLSRPFSYDYVV